MAYLLVVSLLLSLLACGTRSQPDKPRPLLELSGDVRVIMLFDFHRVLHSNGTCDDLNYEAVQVGQATIWAYDSLKSSDQYRDVGSISLEVYDTCGSARLALEILSEAVSGSGSASRTPKRLAGVLSFTDEVVWRRIDEFLSLMGYLHVQLSGTSTDTSRLDRMSKVLIPSPSTKRAQALGRALEMLNWTHLSLVILNDVNSKKEADDFMKVASDFGICISSYSMVSLLHDVFVGNVSTKGLLVIASSILESLPQALDGAHQDGTFIFTGMEDLPDIMYTSKELHNTGNFSTNIFFLTERVNRTDDLQADFVSPRSAKDSSLTFLEAVLKCPSLAQVSCQSELEFYFNLTARHTSVRRGLDGFQITLDIMEQFQAHDCRDFNFQTCGLSLGHMNLSSSSNSSRVQSVNTQICSEKTDLSLEAFDGNGTISMVGLFKDDGFFSMDDSDLLDLAALVPPSKCEGNCQGCSVCNLPAHRQEPAAVLPGKLYIGGLFPIYDSRKSLSHDNIIASEAFIWAVKTFNQRRVGPLTNMDLGAFSINSPGTDTGSESMIKRLENCDVSVATGSESFRINNYDVLTYVKLFLEDDFILERNVNSKKPVLGLSKVGIRQNGRLSGNFWPTRLANLLKGLQWTYPTIIWSEMVAEKSFRHSFENGLRENGVCLAANHLLIKANETHLQSVSQDLISNSDVSSAVILMMDLPFTIDLLQSFVQEVINGSALHFVLFPWNADALLQIPTSVALGSLIVDIKTTKNIDFQNSLKKMPEVEANRYVWLEKLKRDVCSQNCASPTDVTECWENWIEQSAGLSSYVIDVTDNLLTVISAAFDEKCQNLLDNCDIVEVIRSRIQDEDITLPLDIFNMQLDAEKDTTFTQVGSFQSTGEVILDRSSVIFYDFQGEQVTAKSECWGWCPSCHQCSDAFSSRDKYLYTPGDVVVIGVFPIHHSSDTLPNCGGFNPESYVDAEGFHFAVQNIRRRYPKILPNVTIGSLIIDSCQSSDRILQMITNFETCTETYSPTLGKAGDLNPRMVIGYVGYDDAPVFGKMADVLGRFKRVVMTPMRTLSEYPTALGTAESDIGIVEAVVDILAKNNWTYTSIVTSTEPEYLEQLDRFQALASEKDICIAGIYKITTDKESLDLAYSSLHRNRASSAVVTLLNLQNSTSFFHMAKNKKLRRVWVNAGRKFAWVANNSAVALGSLFVERPKSSHEAFERYLSDLDPSNASNLPWFSDFIISDKPARDAEARDRIVTVISTLDSLIHGFNDFYLQTCPEGTGLCPNMAKLDTTSFTQGVLSATRKTQFLTDAGKVQALEKLSCFLPPGIYDVKNFRRMKNGSLGYTKVAMWDGKLRMEPDVQFEFYDAFGYVRRHPVSSECDGECDCVNPLSAAQMHMGLTKAGLYGDMIYHETTGEFIGTAWAIVVVVIAGSGVTCAFVLILYIISRLCIRSLKVKNVDLGLILLLADILLFLSVLPFVFTPSHVSCGLRYLLTSMSYTLCFAICLTKAMNIYEYSSVGLGGEVSRLNTFVILLFILGVQVAISAQFWITHDNGTTMLTEITQSGKVFYACNFEKRTFVMYMSYVMLLMFLCALYSFGLRSERRNLGETKLLLTCSVLCLIVWITWIVVLFVKEREFVEPSICVGIVSCATLILVIMFVPKLRRLARPKQYSIQQTETKKGAGQKSQNDFVFDGPYSLPGSMRSKEKPFANSIVALSSDFFY